MKGHVSFLLAAICLPSPATGESPEAQRARRELVDANTCSIPALGPLHKLIDRYKSSTDTEVEIIVANARYTEAFVHWFHQDDAADLFLRRVIDRYDHASDSKLEAVAAEARITISSGKHSGRFIRRYIAPIIARYSGTDDVDLAEAYAKALERLSDVERHAGHVAEAQRLYAEAGRVYAVRINPFLKPAVASNDDDLVCL